MANRFVNEQDLLQIDLGDGDWVKVPSRLSFAMVSDLADVEGKDSTKTLAFITRVIREWNLKDAEGKGVPLTEENIKKLDLDTVKMIGEAIAPLVQVPKKG